MSPSKKRKKRRRFAVAALAANSMGTAAGLATQALIRDPATSVLIGTVVAGTIGDVLLQLAHDDDKTGSPGHKPGCRCPRAGGPDSHHDHHRPRSGTGAGHARHPPYGSARCLHRQGGRTPPRPAPCAGTGEPHHPRHRQLRRGARRFVRRVRPGRARPYAPGSGDATS